MLSPLDYRYFVPGTPQAELVGKYLSYDAFIGYCARVEAALARTLADLGICTAEVAAEIAAACERVTVADVREVEATSGHEIRALVSSIQRGVSDTAAPYVHLFATSSDIVDTSNALRVRDFTSDVLLPDLIELADLLAHLGEAHAGTPQVGRTHGRHAVPLTFGFAVALYVDRLVGRIEAIAMASNNLRGKMSGAVGGSHAFSIARPDDPGLLEEMVLSKLNLRSSISSQIVQPEFMADLMYAVTSCFGVLANIADDARHLHRSEIAEIEEAKTANAIGSSTMPHKVNPTRFENVKSLWKAFLPRLTMVLLDQVSEHQRDLTNSASSRFYLETLAALDYAAVELKETISGVSVDAKRMAANLDAAGDSVLSEALSISLLTRGVRDGYELVHAASQAVHAGEAHSLSAALGRMAENRRDVGDVLTDPRIAELLRSPRSYHGATAQLAVKAAADARQRLEALRASSRP